jgi:hypothetical protein
MRVLVAASALVLVPLGLAAQDVPAEKGQEFTPINKRFTVVVPGGGTFAKRTQIIPIRVKRGRKVVAFKLPIEEARTTRKDGTTFTAGSLGVPAVLMSGIPADERQRYFRDLLARRYKAKVLSDKDLKQGAFVGKEYTLEAPGRAGRMRLFLNAGWVLHAVVEGKTVDAVTSREADEFFNSFKLSEKE